MICESVLNLVLLPGMDGTGELFEYLIAELPSEINTIVVAFPNNSVMSYEELTEFVRIQIPKELPYVLLGESFSGPIAIALAANANEKLICVVLSCTFAVNPRPLLSKLSFLVPQMEFSDKLINALRILLLSSFRNDQVFDQLKNALHKISSETMRARLDEVIHVDYLAKLTEIKVPILYLKGKQDYLVPASASRKILKFSKYVTIVELDAPHLLLQVVAKDAAKLISSYISKVLANNIKI